jgi:glycosyltransferase involved in cell wall biosynthesis
VPRFAHDAVAFGHYGEVRQMIKEKLSVSAVIPTRNRPDSVCKAVRSVLSQTSQVDECIVVIDGPDPVTINALKIFEGTNVKVMALDTSVGGGEARNIGARAAQFEWVALLDDDDEWLPTKIEEQLNALANAEEPVEVIFSRYVDRGASGDLIRPPRFPRVGEPISEYLWCNSTPFGGFSPQTSTWVIRREFFLKVPFTKGLKALQDLDWLLRAFEYGKTRYLSVEEPLAIFHNENSFARITSGIGWKFCYEWGMTNIHRFTRKAFGFYLAIFCINRAMQQRATLREVMSLLRDIWRFGRLSTKLIFLCFLYVFVYPLIRRFASPRSLKIMLYRTIERAECKH